MKITQILWKIINNYKIKYVFGIPGSPIVSILAYKPKNITWINVGNELDNGFIAQSYGFFSQKVGVLIVTAGPGICTTLSSLVNSLSENNPLVVISTIKKTKYGFQNFDIVNVLKNIINHTVVIRSTDDFQTKINYAFYIAQKYNTCVCVLIESNILLDTIQYSNKKFIFKEKNKNNDYQIVQYIKKNLTNTDTLLIIGHIPHINYKLLKKFLNNNNIPYVLSWKERILFNNNKKNYCGLIGSLGNHSANYAIYHSKNILIFGDISPTLIHNSSYSEAFSLDYFNNKNIYNIVIEKSHSFKQSTKTFIINDINYILKNLKLNVSKNFILKLKYSNSILNKQPIMFKSDLEKYCYISSTIYREHKLNIPVITGVGNHWYAIGKYFRSNYENNWISSTTWASIGCGYFYGLGAYLATKKPIWIIEGDGGTIFAGTTLLYLINNKNLPLTIIIFKDNQYSAIVSSFHLQKLDIKHKHNEKIITTPPHINYDILPNCHHFYNIKKYEEYLNKYPISNKLRFIIVHLKQNNLINNNNSYVYSTNIHDSNYINLIKNDKFVELNNFNTVHKLDIS